MYSSEERADDQLDFFGGLRAPAPIRHRAPGEVRLRLRHDQAILGGIALLIGLTVVFAWGVERGKQIARLERPLLRPHEFMPSRTAPESPQEPAADQTPAVLPEESAPGGPAQITPVKAERSTYAVQVVTYSRPQLARSELERLHKTGEEAFVREYRGRTVLYVGPFANVSLAREKQISLKARYQDCFVSSL